MQKSARRLWSSGRLPANRIGYVLCGVVLVLGLGCSREVAPTKEALEARCKQYWELRQNGNWGGVYNFLSPEERKFAKRDDFVADRSKQLAFREYRIESIDVKGSQGTVRIKTKWRVTIPGDQQPYREGESAITEMWIYAEGNWYIQLLNPPMQTTK